MATASGGGPGAEGGGVEEGLGANSSPPRSAEPALGAHVAFGVSGGGGGGGARDICREVIERLVAGGHVEAAAACGPEFRARLATHFALLPASYQLDVDVDKAEDVLIHQKVLEEAKDPDRRPAFHVHYLRLEELNVDTTTNSDAPEEDDAGDDLSTRSGISHRHIHEIIFGSIDNPRLLSQLSAVLSDIGLNVRDVHVFSTKDGYSLDVFVVDGWPIKDTDGLHKTLEASILRKEAKFSFNSGGMRVRPQAVRRVKVKKLRDVKNKRKSQELNKEYHQNMMTHFHAILATEVSFLIPMMTAVFAVKTPVTIEARVMLIFVFLVSGAAALFGLIMSSGTVERMWLPVVGGITLFVTVFSLGLFHFAMGLFFPEFDMKAANNEDYMEHPWYILGNILAFLVSATAIVFSGDAYLLHQREHQGRRARNGRMTEALKVDPSAHTSWEFGTED